MADTTTTNVSLTKPEVGASADTWGTKINTNFDTLDNLFTTGPALLISKGGTSSTTASGARTALGLGTVAVEDTVPVAKGGTGSTTLTANNVLLGNGTSALQAVAPSTSGNVLTSNGTTWQSIAPTITINSVNGFTGTIQSVLVSGTVQASTSGTSIDFTSIPSWVKRISVMLKGVSTNGSSPLQIQIGSGSVTTTGYASTSSVSAANSGQYLYSTSGFALETTGNASSGYVRSGIFQLFLIGSNTWAASGNIGGDSGVQLTNACAGSSPALGGALDRVRITTTNGTDAFDAGSINILYE